MNNDFRYFCLLILFFFPALLPAQRTPVKENFPQVDTLRNKSQKLILPILYYTPESSLALGVGGQIFFHTKNSRANTRPSDLFLYLTYTLRRQLSVSIRPRIYFRNETYFLDAELKHKENRYSFWGIGNNTPAANEEEYRETIGLATLTFLRRIPDNFNVGLRYSYFYYKTKEVEERGLLDEGAITGRLGTQLSAIGPIINLDSRDNVYSPRRGVFLQLESNWMAGWLGSQHQYVEFIYDLRSYFPLGRRATLAVQAFSQMQFGEVPFQTAARFGGGERGRGYFQGRYIDQHMYSLQAEYRLRLWRRWKVAAFLLCGEVAGDPLGFLDEIKYAGGGGVRWQPLPNNEAAVRVDIAFNREGEFRWYIGLNEAF